MNYLKTLIITLLLPIVANASPWDTQYKQIEQSIRCPQFADRTFNITKYGASTKATAKKNQTAINKAIDPRQAAARSSFLLAYGTREPSL